MSSYIQETLQARISKHFLKEPYSKQYQLCRSYGLFALHSALSAQKQSQTIHKRIEHGFSPGGMVVKNFLAIAGDTEDTSLIPGLGVGNGNPLNYFFFFLPGIFHGQRSLAGYSPWGCKESGMTEHTCIHLSTF